MEKLHVCVHHARTVRTCCYLGYSLELLILEARLKFVFFLWCSSHFTDKFLRAYRRKCLSLAMRIFFSEYIANFSHFSQKCVQSCQHWDVCLSKCFHRFIFLFIFIHNSTCMIISFYTSPLPFPPFFPFGPLFLPEFPPLRI